MFLISALLTIVSFLLLFYMFRRMSRKLSLPPGPRGVPFFGNSLEVTERNIFDKLLKYADQYGDIVRIKLLNRSIVCLNSSQIARKALCRNPCMDYMNDRGTFFFSEFLYYGSQSLAFYKEANSIVHKEMRKGYIRALHVHDRDGSMAFDKLILSELDNLNERIEAFGGKEFEVLVETRRSLTNVISILLGGEPILDDDEDISIFLDFIDEIFFLINPTVNILLQCCPLLRYALGFRSHISRICNAKKRLFDKFITKRKNNTTNGCKCFVDILFDEQRSDLEEGKQVIFTDERIKSCILETVLAGINTIWSVLSSTILCLVNHPEYQDQLFEELVKNISQERKPNYKDKVNCPKLEAVEMEVHRLFTVIPTFVGHVSTKDVKLDGFNIPEGTEIMVNTWRIHHDSKTWDDPWTFKPERFLDNDGRLIARESVIRKNWIPFSMGKRQCVGEQFARSRYFLYMASLLRKWKFVGVPGKFSKLDPKQLLNYDTKVMIRPKPFFCTAEKRF